MLKRKIALYLAFALLLSGCEIQEQPEETTRFSIVKPADTTTAPPTQPTQAETNPTQGDTQPPVIQEVPEADALVRVADYIPGIREALAYATVNNFSGQRIYDFTDAYLRYGTVQKLKAVSEELAEQGIGLLIWDGFRPVDAQQKLWDICPDPTFVSHPVTGKRAHCRGNAVDLTVVDLQTGAPLPVPTGFDNFTAFADRDYTDCSEEAARNARFLEDTMEKHGFQGYSAEWWHFTDTTEYPVEEYFDPSVPSRWEANCREYISLRSVSDNKTVRAKIEAGDAVNLLAWKGKSAYVSYGELSGYVLSDYIKPENENYFADLLDTVIPTDVYTYDQLIADIQALQDKFPEDLSAASLGTSELGRNIPVLRIGNLDARYHVLLQGAVHGSEHMTAWLLMAMADYWLANDIGSYGDVCYHIIPMSNPDGVTISQTGMLTQEQRMIFANDKKNNDTDLTEDTYCKMWKANGFGVDINRNFSSGWELIDDRTAPSAQQYRGTAPFDSAEAAALRDYTLQFDFDATVSYHATGSIIYYEYGDKQGVNSQSKSLANSIKTVTGYPLEEAPAWTALGIRTGLWMRWKSPR